MKVAHYTIALFAIFGVSGVLAGNRNETASEKAVIESPTEWIQISSLISWDSRYGAEGRDSLDGEGIASILLEMEICGWRFGSWLAESGGADYDERNFYVEYDFEWSGLDGYFGYKFLQFPGDANASDSEFGAGLSGPELPMGIVPEINWYYSVDAGGSYIEAGLTREFIPTDQLLFIPSVYVGRNDGYVSDGHNGADHVRVALETHYKVNESVTIQAHIGKSFAIDSSPGTFAGDDLLRDFVHGGVGIAVSF